MAHIKLHVAATQSLLLHRYDSPADWPVFCCAAFVGMAGGWSGQVFVAPPAMVACGPISLSYGSTDTPVSLIYAPGCNNLIRVHCAGLCVLLALVMGKRFQATKKLMPAGMIAGSAVLMSVGFIGAGL